MKVKTDFLSYLYEEPGPRTKRMIRFVTVLSALLVCFLLFLVYQRFAINGQLRRRYWYFFLKRKTQLFILKGLWGTMKISLTAALITFSLGFLMMFGRVRGNRFAASACRVLSEFTRGVPTLLFVYFFFFIPPMLHFRLPAFWMIAFPVAISASGSVSEVLRGGVNAVEKGQWEASLSLGLSENRTFFKIIFPQAFSYVIPSLISELVIVLKDTTFAYIVSYNDLMQNATVLISNYDALLSVYLVVAVLYIIINYLLNKLSVRLARKKRS